MFNKPITSTLLSKRIEFHSVYIKRFSLYFQYFFYLLKLSLFILSPEFKLLSQLYPCMVKTKNNSKFLTQRTTPSKFFGSLHSEFKVKTSNVSIYGSYVTQESANCSTLKLISLLYEVRYVNTMCKDTKGYANKLPPKPICSNRNG